MNKRHLGEKTRHILEDLIEQAEKLGRFKFNEHVKDLGLGFHMNKQESDSWIIDFDLPNEKERDATLFTFRLFNQHNEGYSFHRLDELLKNQDLSDEFKNKISTIRHTYFKYLEGFPVSIEANFFEPNKQPTRGDILKTVMNGGGLGHTNSAPKREIYKKWTRDEIRENVLLQEFTKIVLTILGFIKDLADATRYELNNFS